LTSQAKPPVAGGHPEPAAPGQGWLMGRVFGIPVYVAPSWLLIAALITIMFAPNVGYAIPEIGAGKYAVSFAYAVLLYASVFVHELGHAVTALRMGLPVRKITLQLLGGVTEMGGEARTPGREFAVAGAGPALSVFLGFAALISIHALGGEPGGFAGPSAAASAADAGVGMRIALELLDALMFANFAVAVFNLLPGLPLDGGIMLRSVLWRLTGRTRTATVAAGWIGRGLAVLVFLAPFAIEAATDLQLGIFAVLWGALLGGFIWMGATAAMRGAEIRERLPSLQARRLTRRAIPVQGELPLGEALRQAHVAGAQGLVVVDAGGRPVGLVNEASVSATPEQRRPWVQVATLSRRLEPGLVIPADLFGEELLRRLEATPATEYLVVEPNGDIFGILAASDVRKAVTTPAPGSRTWSPP
jgi:Zn-dependent protease